ncbi:helix-turn-helix transcriptional regulator [Mycobacterium sp. WMMD1722]|uniref:helix-turn-helix transcriptional regulator n=1 Tax=Mycobacterium sp. WMMD1722 TaxID=3404117 RepID=UPI003BF4732B
MNRADRLYSIVEELRAVSPRPRTASWLAERFEISTRTIERDLTALRESGVAIRGGVGRAGGYFLDRDRTLPPVTLTATEALAISVALRSVTGSPFAASARVAAQKVLAVLPADMRTREQALAARVHTLGEQRPRVAAGITDAVTQAVSTDRVLHLDYVDRDGARTRRDVEPLGFLWSAVGWYLVGWCRLRSGVRGFLLDRIVAAELTDERAPAREVEFGAELDRIGAAPLDR